MTVDFDTAFDAWVACHQRHGFAATAFLNPPASDRQLADLAVEIGFALPDDLKHLWMRADGQRDIWEIDDPAPGTILSPFFGSYEFASIERTLTDYRRWKEIFDDAGDSFDANFNGGMITVRGDDPVHAEYWRPGWLPFSHDGGGNAYTVDLDPKSGGSYGQVILIGPDEDQRRVLAPSLSALLADAARRDPPLGTDGEGHLAYFDFEPIER